MENHEHLRVKSPMSTEFIQHKMVRATFTRDNGLTKESGIGDNNGVREFRRIELSLDSVSNRLF